jgi:hypothetical protein
MTYQYGILSWATIDGRLKCVRYTSTDICGAFDAIGKPLPAYLHRLITEGVHYSNEDFDTLSAALHELRAAGVDTLSAIPYKVLDS